MVFEVGLCAGSDIRLYGLHSAFLCMSMTFLFCCIQAMPICTCLILLCISVQCFSFLLLSLLCLHHLHPWFCVSIFNMAFFGVWASLDSCILASPICHIRGPSISSITPGPNGLSLSFSVCTVGLSQTSDSALLSHWSARSRVVVPTCGMQFF